MHRVTHFISLRRFPPWRLFVAQLLSFCLGTYAAAQAPVVLHTVAESGAEPKWIADAGGICPDILHALEIRMPDLKIVVGDTAMPQIRAIESLAKGRVDLLCGLGRRSDDAARYRVIETVLWEDRVVVVVRADDPISINSLADLRAASQSSIVLVNHGAKSIPMLDQAGVMNLDTVAPSTEVNLRKLQAKHGRIMFTGVTALAWDVQRLDMAGRFRAMPLVDVPSSQHYMLVGKHVPRDVADRLEAELRHLQADGTLAAISGRWQHMLTRSKPEK
ncbi:MAG: ABC transporter substrate-binding protein [Burkholderiales bacterium]|nr:ABC transporter substrate-binding protein [Burkholderiales bacterium]